MVESTSAGPGKSKVDYVHDNIEVFYEEQPQMNQAARRQKIDRNIELLKSRQLAAKHRRMAKGFADEKLRILQRFRWPLVKYVREKALAEKGAELAQQRWARVWLVLLSAKQTMAKFKRITSRLLAVRRLDIAKAVIAVSMMRAW